ncbi:ketopantoate reductase family protein [Pseudomonas sp. GM60]|uniref:ketopantoate reductase family protein n=1 Tax=Pseudomonas sp. GM60 TaxID=1144334 RepID=UPI001EE67B45|nr:ketopantoate reductase C-terminal domain-containing protein [Pseudomonas sp. GM60]
MGTINCLMRGSIGDVASVKGGHAFAMRAIDEVVSIVRAVGQEPSEPFLAQANRLLTLEGSPQTSSMYRDLMAGRGIEADQIIGDLLERANAKGL